MRNFSGFSWKMRAIFLSAQQDTRIKRTPACLTERHFFVQETAKLFGGLTVGENGGVECGVVVVLHGDHGPEVPLHELRVVLPGHGPGGHVKKRDIKVWGLYQHHLSFTPSCTIQHCGDILVRSGYYAEVRLFLEVNSPHKNPLHFIRSENCRAYFIK